MGSSGAARVLRSLVEEHGYIAETFDPGLCNASVAVTSGSVFCCRLWVPKAGTVSNIGVQVASAGVTLTAGQNLLGLYTDAGVKMAETDDQSTAWASTGQKFGTLTAPQAVAGGTHYRALILAVGATPPSFQRGSSGPAAGASLGLAGASLRFGRVSTGQTALPASFSPAGLADASSSWLVVLT